MNQIFNFQRFWNYFSKELFEKKYLLLGIIVFVSLLVNLIYKTAEGSSRSKDLQQFSLFLCLIITPPLLINLVLNQFSTKTKSLHTLTLPVSFFEKWLYILLVVFLVYVPLILIVLKMTDLFYVTQLQKVGLIKYKLTKREVYEYLSFIDFSFNNSKVFFGHFMKFTLSVSALSLLGTLYFRRYSFVLTLLMIVVGLVFLTFFRQYLFEAIILKGAFTNIVNFSSVQIPSKAPYHFYHVSATDSITNLSNFFMSFILPSILWVAALIGFKEKEI